MSLTILIVDDEENFRTPTCQFLEKHGHTTIQAGTMAEARKHIQQGATDLILLDASLPDGHGPALLEETAHLLDRPPIILITGNGDIEMAVEAMDTGAFYFFIKPVNLPKLAAKIESAAEQIRMLRELHHFRTNQSSQHNFVLGNSPQMELVMNQAERAAKASTSVLITGETGTGKEVLARALHRMGSRSTGPFVPINCAAIQSTMLESELFGYHKGAFTGADNRKIGLMQVADKGVLFLDEISSMPLDIQDKLLRALEERSFMPMGATKEVQVDIQIVAASNRNLMERIKEGDFREDLYYRLKVIDLHLPPLRERRQDIPDLVGYFIRHLNMQMGLSVPGITSRALDRLAQHNWPGNIRELRNVVEHAMLFSDNNELDIAHFPADINRDPFPPEA